MKQTFSLAIAILLSLGLNAGLARAADEQKIAFVDMPKALQTVEAGKKARASLEKEANSKKKSLQDEDAQIKKMIDEFKKKSLAMSDDARMKKQQEIQERAMRFEELKMRTQGELEQKQAELAEPIVNKLRDILSELAKSKGYTAVIEKNKNVVLYSLDKDDLTNELIERYNKANKS